MRLTVRILIGQLNHVTLMPLRVNDGDILIRQDAFDTNHNRIALNLSSALNFAFRDINYEVFISDVRLWIPEKRIYTYLDVMIVAGEPAYFENRTDTILNPQVIVEVLSQSTETYDRERTFAAYRTIPTFREYLLVDQTSILVEQLPK